MRSIRDAVEVVPSIHNASFGSATPGNTNGTTVDTKGYNTAMIVGIASQTAGASSATLVCTLQESSDNTSWANALDNTGTVIGFTLLTQALQAAPAGSAAGLTTVPTGTARIEGLGLNRKRYLRVVGTSTYTAGYTTVATFAIALGRAYQEPVPNTGASNT